jgi:hypothetical protein
MPFHALDQAKLPATTEQSNAAGRFHIVATTIALSIGCGCNSWLASVATLG